MRNTIIALSCPICGADHEVEVNFEAYCEWIGGELIQRAMPDLTPTEREQLISQLCPKCQDDIFGIGEEEDEDYEPADIDSDLGFDPYMGCYTDDC